MRLKDLAVFSEVGEPATRTLLDGRPVVEFMEDDGEIRRHVIEHTGNSVPLDSASWPQAKPVERKPSIGVGIRRESEHGPHIGPGYGTQIPLTGYIENNRNQMVTELKRLIEKAERGDFDELLELPRPA